MRCFQASGSMRTSPALLHEVFCDSVDEVVVVVVITEVVVVDVLCVGDEWECDVVFCDGAMVVVVVDVEECVVVGVEVTEGR